MSWRNQPMCGWDTETDSLLPDEAHIVSACVGIAGPTGWTPRNWLLKPDRPIAEDAAAIHGITTEYATEHGTDRREGLADIRSALMNAWAQGWPVVAFNATYDFTVLDRELRRNGMTELVITGPVIDPFVLDKAADPYRKGSRKLVDVAAHYGITLSAEDAHGAEADALAACRIAWKLGAATLTDEDYSKTGMETESLPLSAWSLADLHQLQADAYREQCISLAKYFRTKKNDPATAAEIEASTDWPIKPWVPAQQELIA